MAQVGVSAGEPQTGDWRGNLFLLIDASDAFVSRLMGEGFVSLPRAELLFSACPEKVTKREGAPARRPAKLRCSGCMRAGRAFRHDIPAGSSFGA